MDEIDNIIIHTLRQIGCNIDDDVTNLGKFSPEQLVAAVSKCLLLIDGTLELPTTLPPGMAQRYGATMTLAEACKAVGFRGDIGYQTFLYSNIIEVRRVFMFLIERLPRESDKSLPVEPTDKLTALEREMSRNISLQLNSAWTPQYCKKYGIAQYGNVLAVQGSIHEFQPQRLNIPHVTKTAVPPELRDYWLKRSPSIFQQTRSNTLCASIIHRNDIDLHKKDKSFERQIDEFKIGSDSITSETDVAATATMTTTATTTTTTSTAAKVKMSREHIRNVKSVQQLTLNNVEIPNENDIVQMPEISPIDALTFDIEKLKQSIEQCVSDRKHVTAKLSDLKVQKQAEELVIVKLKDERKIKERTNILLENPEVNMTKMKTVLAATAERIKKLEEQWEEHRTPLTERLERAQQSTSKQYSQTRHIMDQVKSTRIKADEVSEDLKNKISVHTQLVDEFDKVAKDINRNAYTSRILEIIGNIRKQRNDIDKILDDTRLLQKEINTITGQLDRQFTVTDDLLFKNAKRDEHTRKAYKLLATLHADCSDLVSLVQETGGTMREVRDLEDQIETEKSRHVADNLKRITADLKLLEREGIELQDKIKKASDQSNHSFISNSDSNK